MWLSGAIVFVVLGIGSGVWIPRRMLRYWPGSQELTGDQRVTVTAAVRSGASDADPALHQAVLDYSSGLRRAAQDGRFWRWLIIVVLVAAIVAAAWDSVYGTWLARLLDSAQRAADSAERF